MKYVRHDFSENYLTAVKNQDDALLKDVVLDELGKLVLMHPKVVAEALQKSGVSVSESPSKKEMANAIVENKGNKGLMNRLGKLTMLINAKDKDNKFLNMEGSMGDSSRGWLSKGADYLKENKEITHSLCGVLPEALDEEGAKQLNGQLEAYSNFGGRDTEVPFINTENLSKTQVFGLLVVGAVIVYGCVKLSK
jgi:hypothetical protein